MPGLAPADKVTIKNCYKQKRCLVQLTEAQLERQDFVDNVIHELLETINPSGKEISWNIEAIGDIRDTIQYWLVEHYKLTDEITFYPFLSE